MATILLSHITDCLDAFPPSTFAKGQSYYFANAVQHIDLKRQDYKIHIHAFVSGSKKRPYNIEIELDIKNHTIISVCSCPLREDCKHVVATLLEAKKILKPQTAIPHPLERPNTSSLTLAQLETWMSSLTENAPKTQKPSEHRWAYVFECSHKKVEGLQLSLTKLLKTGGYGTPKPIKTPSTTAQQAATEADWVLKGLLDAAAIASNSSQSNAFISHFSCKELSHFNHMDQLLETGRCFLDHTHKLKLQKGPSRNLTFAWNFTSSGQYELLPKIEGLSKPLLLQTKSLWYIDENNYQVGALTSDLSQKILRQLLNAPTIPIEAASKISSMLTEQCPNATYLVPPVYTEITKEIPPKPELKLFGAPAPSYYIYNEKILPFVELSFNYDGTSVKFNDLQPVIYKITNQTRLKIPRNLTTEKEFIARLQQTPLQRISDLYTGYISSERTYQFGFPSSYTDQALEAIRELVKEGWSIHIEKNFPLQWIETIEDWHLQVDAQSDAQDWFNVQLGVQVNGETIDLLPLIKKCLSLDTLSLDQIEEIGQQKSFKIEIAHGKHVAIPGPRLQHILMILLEMHNSNKQGALHRTRSHTLLEWANAFSDKPLTWKGTEELKQLAEQLIAYSPTEKIAPPLGLNAQLRPYQLAGLSWLQFLRSNQCGGILADDMGLGKTIQTLAHLLIEKESGRMKGPSLIVAPTSLMGNWKAEAARFTPALNVLILQGLTRKILFEAIQESDLILTTYPLLARDEDALLKHSYYYLILDEAQTIKNTQTKATQIACSFQARHRLCLTGTPIENHLGELWSLFHFLSPGLLGTQKQFNRFFRTPIEKQSNITQQKKLQRRVSPFMLRRLKTEVATELPLKTEIIHQIPLSGEQSDLYESIRLSMHEKVKSVIQEKGLARSQIIILDALLKLRQACCDPRLVKLDTAKTVKTSHKLNFLMEMLTELVQEKRKVLLFSSFTSMLKLIEEQLVQRSINYVKLTGETQNRTELIQSFQEGEIPLFLLSLKAGGTGLNLTAADTVIHYDPWWNPAAEQQATDRAYRIGQQKPVFVYKLIAQNTIEDKILTLQQKKQALINQLYDAQESQNFSFSEEDLEELFQPIS